MLSGDGDRTLWNFVDSSASAHIDLTIVTNKDSSELAAVARRRAPGVSQWQQQDLGSAWPSDVFSLSHVALPFPPDDPLYGGIRSPWLIQPGQVQAKGERGLFVIPMDLLARQRFNPFYAYVEQRVVTAVSQLTGR